MGVGVGVGLVVAVVVVIAVGEVAVSASEVSTSIAPDMLQLRIGREGVKLDATMASQGVGPGMHITVRERRDARPGRHGERAAHTRAPSSSMPWFDPQTTLPEVVFGSNTASITRELDNTIWLPHRFDDVHVGRLET